MLEIIKTYKLRSVFRDVLQSVIYENEDSGGKTLIVNNIEMFDLSVAYMNHIPSKNQILVNSGK